LRKVKIGEVDTRHGVRNLSDLISRAGEGRDTGLLSSVDEGSGIHAVQAYRSLSDEARHLLAGLRAKGLRPGDRVALLTERSEQFIPLFWASVFGGYLACPLTPLYADSDRWAAQLGHVDELLDDPLLVTTGTILSEMPPVPGLSVAVLEELPADAPETEVHRAEPDVPALLMLTSGSTGNSKAVVLTHGNLLASMSAKAERLGLTADDVTMNWVAFDHIAAVEGHLLPLSVGATQLHVEPQRILGDPLEFLRLVDTHRITLTFTPNFLLRQINDALARQPEEFSVDLSSLRHILCGGEAVVCATANAFLKRLAGFGLDRGVLVPGFGMTETCAGSVLSTDFPDVDADAEFASLGTPVPGLEMRVVDDDDVPLGDGEVGEFQVRGPMAPSTTRWRRSRRSRGAGGSAPVTGAGSTPGG
jgi:acyl-CoA synthetase (AMP-forming)/AMP-acid ligase II